MCTDETLIQIFRLINIAITMLQYIAPVILIILILIDIFKSVISGDAEFKKMSKSIITRIIAAIIVFLIPIIIDFAVGLVSNDSYLASCYINSSTEDLEEARLYNSYLDKYEDYECTALDPAIDDIYDSELSNNSQKDLIEELNDICK